MLFRKAMSSLIVILASVSLSDARLGDNNRNLHAEAESPTSTPTTTPTPVPTTTPTATPTFTPTTLPTSAPTATPTFTPTTLPTSAPTAEVSTLSPTQAPAGSPTSSSTSSPTATPTATAPTAEATTLSPTQAPTSGNLDTCGDPFDPVCAHDNALYLDPVYYDSNSDAHLVKFECTNPTYNTYNSPPPSNTYSITSKQPFTWKGCSMSGGIAKLDISAGRKKSDGPAGFFKGGLNNLQMIAAYDGSGYTTPGQLNFAVNVGVKFTYSDGTVVDMGQVRIGQGSTVDPLTGYPVNNWWIGSPQLYDAGSIGIVQDYESIKNGATINTVGIGWNRYAGGSISNTFQIAYCPKCTLSIIEGANQRAEKEYKADQEMSLASALADEVDEGEE